MIEIECGDIGGGSLWGYAPFTWAASNGHEEVIKILHGREGVNLDKPDNFGRTPLSRATGHRHEEAVKVLLGREEVSPDKPDNEGQTPLSYAAHGGQRKVVKILLVREESIPISQIFTIECRFRLPLWGT